MEPVKQQTPRSFYVLISVFFFWGFVAASNTILIPLFKKNFILSQTQSQWVDSAFYLAYGVGSLIYFLWSVLAGDPLNKIGYKKGLIIGLLISAAGTLLFIPAASGNSFPLMLGGLFVVAFGFALQQIVANPYVIALGRPETGAHRNTLAGAINSFGTTIGPLIVAWAIFGDISNSTSDVGIDTVKTPYLALGIAFILFATVLGFSKLPPVKNEEKASFSLGVFRYPQLILGMIAIFIYVGVEVSTQSNLPELMRQKEFLGLESDKSVHFISLYWGCLMIGRWTGSINAFDLKKRVKEILMIVVPVVAYAVIILVNYIKGSPLNDLFGFFPFIILLIVASFIVRENPVRTMFVFGTLAAVMMIVGLMTTGRIAVYSFISGGLFCSVMWPCIFALSIAGLGKYTAQGSSLLIMMILGGAVIPVVQAKLSEGTSIHMSYIVPVICFAYLAFFGWRLKGILRKQGIDYEKVGADGGH
ncbi:MAG: major facilitator superfamily 1 [Bacteroidetes bacterium]|jgi:FHS family L-fucose permease-like MFS transporter|nr:major facilitator superfamily 1 [Bacteroidota bacterium]